MLDSVFERLRLGRDIARGLRHAGRRQIALDVLRDEVVATFSLNYDEQTQVMLHRLRFLVWVGDEALAEQLAVALLARGDELLGQLAKAIVRTNVEGVSEWETRPLEGSAPIEGATGVGV